MSLRGFPTTLCFNFKRDTAWFESALLSATLLELGRQTLFKRVTFEHILGIAVLFRW